MMRRTFTLSVAVLPLATGCATNPGAPPAESRAPGPEDRRILQLEPGVASRTREFRCRECSYARHGLYYACRLLGRDYIVARARGIGQRVIGVRCDPSESDDLIAHCAIDLELTLGDAQTLGPRSDVAVPAIVNAQIEYSGYASQVPDFFRAGTEYTLFIRPAGAGAATLPMVDAICPAPEASR